MRLAAGCVVLMSLCAARVSAQAATWHAEAAGAALVEAWDLNDGRETIGGLFAGVDRRMWRGLAARAEGVVLGIGQRGNNALLGGILVGTRTRWGAARRQPYVDVAAGLSQSTQDVPPGGTSFNFLIAAGAGVSLPTGRVSTTLGGRWLHISNSGREGNDRNPDIQALGFVVGVGWSSRQ